mmetsp:Transcript_4516/g.12750  ORF Transcript_4516/g.12750 Transcript_4516/m.12750 type:complete len:214 (-) Transcript_4516:1607-2248(-)
MRYVGAYAAVSSSTSQSSPLSCTLSIHSRGYNTPAKLSFAGNAKRFRAPEDPSPSSPSSPSSSSTPMLWFWSTVVAVDGSAWTLSVNSSAAVSDCVPCAADARPSPMMISSSPSSNSSMGSLLEEGTSASGIVPMDLVDFLDFEDVRLTGVALLRRLELISDALPGFVAPRGRVTSDMTDWLSLATGCPLITSVSSSSVTSVASVTCGVSSSS